MEQMQGTRHSVFSVIFTLLCLAFCVPSVFASEFSQLEEDLSVKQRDFKHLLEDFSQTLDELESTKADLDKEKQTSAALDNRVKDLGSRLESVSQDLQKNSLRATSDSSNQTKGLAEAGQSEAEKFDTLTQMSRENGRLIDRLTSERDKLKLDVDLLKKDLDSNQMLSENKSLISKQRKLEGELKNATRQSETLRAQLTKLKDSLGTKVAREKTVFGDKITQLDLSLAKKQDEVKSLQKTINVLRTDNIELGKMLTSTRDKNRELISGSTDVTLRFLQDRVAIEKEVGGKLAQVKELAVSKIKDKQAKMSDLIGQRNGMTKRLAKLEAENLAMKNQIKDLNSKVSSTKTVAKSAVQKLIEKLKEEQGLYGKKLNRIKRIVNDKVASKNSKISDFGNKVESMMASMTSQKKKYSAVFQQLQVAQASLEAFKTRGPPVERVSAEDAKDQRASKYLAKNVEKLEEKLTGLQTREKSLFKELDLARSEGKILRSSIDQMHESNEKLLDSNDKLKGKLHKSESALLTFKDKTRELTKREAELVDRVVNLEIQIASGAKAAGGKTSKDLDGKLQLAKADYAKLREEVETLVDKLGKSTQVAENLSHEAAGYKGQVGDLNKELERKDTQVAQLKDKVRSLLSNIGLDGDLLSHDKKSEYLRLVADYEMERLTGTVLKTGKGKMEASLKSLLEDDALLDKMVSRLENNEQQLRVANTQGSFGKIFSGLHKNQLRAEMSKLYGFFLARASTGKAEDTSYRMFKKVAARHFSDPALEDVELKSLADPSNPLMAKIQG